jgi:hypothetical protein
VPNPPQRRGARTAKLAEFVPATKFEPAPIQKHTVRFTPINSQLKRSSKANEESQEDAGRFSTVFSVFMALFAGFG